MLDGVVVAGAGIHRTFDASAHLLLPVLEHLQHEIKADSASPYIR